MTNALSLFTYKEIAFDYRNTGDPGVALSYYELALVTAQETQDRAAESEILFNIGLTHANTGHTSQALDFYKQAQIIRHDDADHLNEARTLNAIGGAYNVLGDQFAARTAYAEAIPILEQLGDEYRAGILTNNVGVALDDLGDLQQASAKYQAAKSTFERLLNNKPDSCLTAKPGRILSICSTLADTLNNIGELYNTTGQPELALNLFFKALTIKRVVKQARGLGMTFSKIGYSHLLLGNLEEAKIHLNQAVESFNEAKDLRGLALTYTFLGMLAARLHETAVASKLFEQSLALHKKTGERRAEAITLNQIGHLFASTDKKDRALASYNDALKLWRDIADEDGQTITLHDLARLEYERGNLVHARNLIKNALQIVEARRAQLSNEKLVSSYFANKQNYYELDVDLQMRLASAEMSENHLVASALETNERARGRHLLDTLAEASLLRETEDQFLVSGNPQLAALLNRQSGLRQNLSSKANARTVLLSRNHTDKELAAINNSIDQLAEQYDEVESRIRTLNPAYASLIKPEPLKAKEIQALLDRDVVLLEYSLGANGSYVWAVTPDSIKGFKLESRDKIETAANRLVQALTARNREEPNETFQQRAAREDKADKDYFEAAAALSKLVIEPVASQLGQKRLVIVADGALQYVPFAALPTSEPAAQPSGIKKAVSLTPTTLISNHAIVSLPSASVLALQRRELANRKLAPLSLAVIADPVFDTQDQRVMDALARSRGNRRAPRIAAVNAAPPSQNKAPVTPAKNDNATLVSALRDVGLNPDGTLRRLLLSRTEAAEISSLVSPKESLKALDFRASRATALSGELSNYRYVHFATHGVLSLEHPELSGIALSMVDEKGQKQDGYLRLYEIYNLNLPAELVVLSACETGVGKQIRGEGLIALTRGFMYAGAKRVVASLWKVDDSATAALMAQFYKEMFVNKRRPAEALKEAQVYISRQKRWRSPYYWAGFVLQGEWR